MSGRFNIASRRAGLNDLERPPTIINSLFLHPHPAALIFDLDGTLYLHSRLRRSMLGRLAAHTIGHPRLGWRTLRALRAYRHAQEELRGHPGSGQNVAREQLRHACQRGGVPEEFMRASVRRWMELEPLRILPSAIRPGTKELLKEAKRLGLKTGVLSDYPAEEKLKSMGLTDLFDVTVSAQDPMVQCFKPNPKGLQIVLERLMVNAGEALYIGDRPEVDAAAARGAGIPSVIVGRRARHPQRTDFLRVKDFFELMSILFPPACVERRSEIK